MHAALDRDVRVCDGRRDQLAQRAQEEGNSGRDPFLLLQHILQLLKDRILKDRVDDEHQCRHHARKQRLWSLLPEQCQQRPYRRRCLRALHPWQQALIRLLVALASRHARVDDPDGVREQDRRRAGNGARNHGFDGSEFLGGAPGCYGCLLKARPRPLIPVVVDEIGDADAEERRVNAGVQPGDALTLHDAPHGV